MKKTLIILAIISISLLLCLSFKFNNINEKRILNLYSSKSIDKIIDHILVLDIADEISGKKIPRDVLEIQSKKIILPNLSTEEYRKLINAILVKGNLSLLQRYYEFDKKNKHYIPIPGLTMYEKEKLVNIFNYYDLNKKSHNYIEINEESINKVNWGYNLIYSKDEMNSKAFKKGNIFKFNDKQISFGEYHIGGRYNIRRFFPKKILEIKKEVKQEERLLLVTVKL